MGSINQSRPLHIFLSFAYEDRVFRDTLDTHLTVLQKAGLIDNWHKHEVLPGSDWQNAVDEQLNQADIILLFITPHFIASNYCYSVQMKQALEKHESGKARVIPILFRPTFWYDLPFAKLQGLPTSGNKTVSEWKNKDRAYVEIIQGIKKAIDDLSLKQDDSGIVPQQMTPLLWNVPYQRNPFFTDRGQILRVLHEAFRPVREPSIQIQVLSGLVGIGKTQIALEYIYQHSNIYQAIFWLKGDTPEAFLADALSLATLLDLPEQKETDQHIVATAVKRALSHLSGWLMIIDNLDAFDLLDDFLPTRGQGNILITTRRQAAGTIASQHKVEKFSPEEGALFLLRRAKVIPLGMSSEALSGTAFAEAKAVYQQVDGHPLALDQAGAYMEETGASLSEYLRLYTKYKLTLLKERRKFATGHPASIATTLAMCIAQARQRNPASLELLSACVFLHHEAIPLALFFTDANAFRPVLQALANDELAFNAALEPLLDLSLLQRHSHTETLSLSHLVQTVVRGEMDAETQHFWVEWTTKALSFVFPEAEMGVWQQCQAYLPHALLAADLIRQQTISCPEAARLLYLVARYLSEVARYPEALTLCEQALLIGEQVHGNNHTQTAHIHQCLGSIHESLGHYVPALQHYEQALAIGEILWGPEHPETAQLLNALGEHFQTAGQFELAEEYYQRALAIRQTLFGLEHPDTASSLNNLAGICEEQGRHEQAEPLYEQALALRERLRGSQHPDTAESLSNIARFYRVRGKYREAQPLYERALHAYEHALGPEHPRVATCCNNFAVFCTALGRYQQAEQLLLRALNIRIQCFGLQHPGVAGSRNHLARVYSKQGRYEEAKEMYEQTLLSCEQQLGRMHPITLSMRTNMGELAFMQGNYTQAEVILANVLEVMTKDQEVPPPEYAPVFHLLGQTYLARAEYEQAQTALTTALAMRQKLSGKTHPETALILKSLGDLASARNSDEQAMDYYQQALDITLMPLGADHPEVLFLVQRLKDLFQKRGREEDAQKLSERLHVLFPQQQ